MLSFFVLSLLTLVSVTLVNKDQLDILASLRESVNEDKVEIEADLKKIRNQLKEANDKNKMQLEQINTLLLERVNLQGDSIDVRERMLARERDLGYFFPTPSLLRRMRILIPGLVISSASSLEKIYRKTSSPNLSPFTRKSACSKSNTRKPRIN